MSYRMTSRSANQVLDLEILPEKLELAIERPFGLAQTPGASGGGARRLLR